jgi:hypothetical protein
LGGGTSKASLARLRLPAIMGVVGVLGIADQARGRCLVSRCVSRLAFTTRLADSADRMNPQV